MYSILCSYLHSGLKPGKKFQKTFTKFLEVIVQLFVTFVTKLFWYNSVCISSNLFSRKIGTQTHMIYISCQNNLILFVLDGVFSSTLSKQNQIIQNVVTNWITVAIRFIQSIIDWGQKKVTKLMLPNRSYSSDVQDNRNENRVLGQSGTRKNPINGRVENYDNFWKFFQIM